MGGVIIDTCIWAGLERRQFAIKDVKQAVGDQSLFLAPPVLAELEYGIYRAKTDGQRIWRMEVLMQVKQYPCLTIDNMTAEIYGRLAATLDNAGTPATHRIHDIWIAALAVQHRCAVLTRNVRDFEGIPGVRLLALP